MAPPPAEPRAADDFGALYRSTIDPLRGYLARFLGDRAEAQDIAHDAYLKTYEAMNEHPVVQPRAYLYTTARRLALNFRMRRGSRMQPTDAAAIEARAGVAPAPIQAVMAEQDRAAYAAAVTALPPGCQEVLVLRLHNGLSPAEIARKLDLAESTVSNQLTRALRLVRAQITIQNNPVATVVDFPPPR
jgi:RNA polymerase sigma factor (sigma-70 family)